MVTTDAQIATIQNSHDQRTAQQTSALLQLARFSPLTAKPPNDG